MKIPRLKNINSDTLGSLIKQISEYKVEPDVDVEMLYNCSIVEVKCTKIKKLLRNKDPFLKYVLLINNNENILELDLEDAVEISKMLKQIMSTQIAHKSDITHEIVKLCLKKIRTSDIKAYIRILGTLDLNSDHICKLRKFFGYDTIYKAYKSIIGDIYTADYTVNEIGLIMSLLNNEKLCFSQSLDTFRRLNEYVSKEMFDKNLISCCIVLMSIVKYIPNVVTDKQNFLNGMLNYILNIFFERTNFNFYNQRDTDVLLNTIQTLCSVSCVQNSSYKLKIGFIRKCIFNIRQFLDSNSSIYEETMSFIAILRALGTFIDLCYETVSDKDTKKGRFKVVFLGNYNERNDVVSETANYVTSESVEFIDTILTLLTSDFIDDLEKYKLPENVCLGYNDNELAKKRFISAKYSTLDKIANVKKISINRVFFYNDIYAQKHPKYIFCNIDKLKKQISWSDLIILATHSKSKAEYIPLLLDECFIDTSEHLSYVLLFIFSIKDDFDTLLFLTVSLTKLDCFNDTEKYREILIYIYLNYIDEEDVRISKSRIYIIKRILQTPNMIEPFISSLVEDLKKEKREIHKNLYPFLYFLIFNLKKIDDKLFFEIYQYIGSEIKNTVEIEKLKKDLNKTNENSFIEDKVEKIDINREDIVVLRTNKTKHDKTIQKVFSNESLNISLLIHLLVIYKPSEEEINSVYSFDNFWQCVAVCSYFKLEKLPEDFIFKNQFNFVLNCNNKERKQIKMLLEKPKKSKYLKCYKILKRLSKL
ncbi:hypothetical protein NGRA_2023 [Nosema granulosis]|uniref:Uncharacterized protein n=1 Tax=Nosema granulosis TaxID=83296 RepID=A0A9P6KYJ6_9MICR|nr:hypothetical protein NGRA_2023 [Nosema granulosis]